MTLPLGVRPLLAKGVRFPTELLYQIIVLILSRYLSDVLIAPGTTRNWDAIGALLHIDYRFRSCTLSVLDILWDGNFVDHKTGCVSFAHYIPAFKLKAQLRHPRNYTHKIEYLRGLAELAQTNPKDVLPPKRHVLLMRPITTPYESLGRHFVVYQARVNMSLAEDDGCDLYDDLPNLTLGYSALPKWLRDHMFSEFAHHVVSNLFVWMRGKSLCSLWSALFFIKGFLLFAHTQALSFRVLVREAAMFIDEFSSVQYFRKITFHRLTIRVGTERYHYRRLGRQPSVCAGVDAKSVRGCGGTRSGRRWR